MQINQYTIEALSLINKDLFDVDKSIGTDLWQSQKVSFLTIGNQIASFLPPSENFATDNLTLTGARTHNFVNNVMTWNNVGRFQANANLSLSEGQASYEFNGYSSSIPTDVDFRIKGLGNKTIEFHSDNKTTAYNSFTVSMPTGSGANPAIRILNPSGQIFTVNDDGFMSLSSGLNCVGTIRLVGGGGDAWTWGEFGNRLLLVSSTMGNVQDIHTNQITQYLPTLFGSSYGTPSSSAIVEMRTTEKGFLPPRMTEAQKLAISSPADGLVVFQTNNTRGLYWYDSTVTSWVLI